MLPILRRNGTTSAIHRYIIGVRTPVAKLGVYID